MILDQRHMSGNAYRKDPGQVAAFWHETAANNEAKFGFKFVQRRDGKDFQRSRKKLTPYMNHSRWVSDCPQDYCNGGIALWPENEEACCLDCGTIFTKIAWPDEAEMNRLLVAALQTPVEHERNWRADEDISDAIERMREQL